MSAQAKNRLVRRSRALGVLLGKRIAKSVIDTQFQFVDLLFDADLGRSERGIGKCHVLSAKIQIIPLAKDRPIAINNPLRADANCPTPTISGGSVEIDGGTR